METQERRLKPIDVRDVQPLPAEPTAEGPVVAKSEPPSFVGHLPEVSRVDGPARRRTTLRTVLTRVARNARRIVHLFFARRQNVVYKADVSGPLPTATPRVPVDVQIAGARDIVEIQSIVPEEKSKEFWKRIERGETCIVARTGGRIASYVWMTCRDHRDAELRTTLRVAGHECVGYDAYTVPDVRGFGIRQRLHVEERRYCRAIGRKSLVFWLSTDAEPKALRVWNELGLHQTPVARVTTYRILLWLRFSRVRELRPR